jgi:hypothetical protein
MTRPVPVTGQLETTVVDFAIWKREALADKRITLPEAVEGLQIAERLANQSRGVIRTVQFASRVLTGKDGMDSDCVRRQWDQRQGELVHLDDYRANNGPQAA